MPNPATHNAGRSRLPPANTLYRMARWICEGGVDSEGKRPSSESSTAGRTRSKNARTSVFMSRLKWNCLRFAVAVFQQDLNPAFRLAELHMTEPRQLDSFFEKFQRRIQRQFAAFELLDDLFEPLQRRLKVRRRLWCFRHETDFSRYNLNRD